MKTTRFLWSLVLLSLCGSLFGQQDYHYKRKLTGIETTWHSITLPDELFSKVSPSLNDLRIYGFTEDNDTVEAPYILQVEAGEFREKEVPFRIINRTQDKKSYFFTLENQSEKLVNSIQLAFDQGNFDWKVNLAGSQNQEQWFTIQENYRILSIKNEQTDYQFTKIHFPDCRYRFLRLQVNSEIKPELLRAQLTEWQEVNGTYLSRKVRSMEVSENKSRQQTQVLLNLGDPIPLAMLKFAILDTLDYYRPVSIEYLADSIRTPKGWKLRYRPLSSGLLSSLEKNEFHFHSTISRQLRITIENHDNEALRIDSIMVKGYKHQLVARFSSPAEYYLYYGSEPAVAPHYDIKMFREHIPDQPKQLTLENEISILTGEQKEQAALFENKAWLWVMMTVIILLLGGFTLKMMRK